MLKKSEKKRQLGVRGKQTNKQQQQQQQQNRAYNRYSCNLFLGRKSSARSCYARYPRTGSRQPIHVTGQYTVWAAKARLQSYRKSMGLWRPTTYGKGLFLQKKAWVYGDPRRTPRVCSFRKKLGSMETHDVLQGVIPSGKRHGSMETHDVRQGVIPSLKAWVCGDLRRTARKVLGDVRERLKGTCRLRQLYSRFRRAIAFFFFFFFFFLVSRQVGGGGVRCVCVCLSVSVCKGGRECDRQTSRHKRRKKEDDKM